MHDNQKKGFRLKKALLIALPCLIVAAIAALLIWFFPNPKTYDLTDYMFVDFTGYDGSGHLSEFLNRDELVDDVLRDNLLSKERFTMWSQSALKNEGYSHKEQKVFLQLSRLYGLHCKTSKRSGLSNGDQVTLTFYYPYTPNQYDNFMFRNMEQTYTVTGLTEPTQIDPFDGVQVDFSGLSPCAEASFTCGENPLGFTEENFEMDHDRALRNGDTVTVLFHIDENYYLDELGYIFTRTAKDFPVSGLGEFVSEYRHLSQDFITSAKEQSREAIQTAAILMYTEIKNVMYVDYVFLYDETNRLNPYNSLGLIYKGEVSIPGGSQTVYFFSVTDYLTTDKWGKISCTPFRLESGDLSELQGAGAPEYYQTVQPALFQKEPVKPDTLILETGGQRYDLSEFRCVETSQDLSSGALQELKAYAQPILQNAMNSMAENGFTVSQPVYVGCYIRSPKEGQTSIGSLANSLDLVYQVDFSSDDFSGTTYMPIRITRVQCSDSKAFLSQALGPDSDWYSADLSCDIPGFPDEQSMYDALIAAKLERYTCEAVGNFQIMP